MSLLLLALLGACGAASSLSGPSLRGGLERQLQSSTVPKSVPDSTAAVAPQCRPGYVDVTGGKAYFWSCAFYCEGGPYFATTGCLCACMRPEQAELVASQGKLPTGDIASATSPPGVFVTTRRPETTRAHVPVQETPIGELAETWEQPSVGGGYIAPPRPSTTAGPQASPSSDGSFSLTVAALICGGVLVAGAATALICLCWMGSKPRKSKPDFRFADIPAVTIHTPAEQCPQPSGPYKTPHTRTSSKTSTASTSSARSMISGSRASSRGSWASGYPSEWSQAASVAGSSVGSGRSSVENTTLWAQRLDPGLSGLEPPQHLATLLDLNFASYGHPHLCARRCVLIVKGGACPSGAACRFCHMQHDDQPVRADRRLRQIRAQTSDQVLLASYLPYILRKAEMTGLLPVVSHLLELLKAELQEPRPPTLPTRHLRQWKKYSFMQLVHSCMHELPPHIDAEVNRLKSNMPPPRLLHQHSGVLSLDL
ncbi:unnamed protein product [Symbiodinium natans]|uniref:C3H1-type domain-containing protein n=1 Tax=Symbiodinium natans TaxID=878477 RepID=A0A812QLB8_9DINO|nr:unnamed protein product [Symbiodinium natans]